MSAEEKTEKKPEGFEITTRVFVVTHQCDLCGRWFAAMAHAKVKCCPYGCVLVPLRDRLTKVESVVDAHGVLLREAQVATIRAQELNRRLEAEVEQAEESANSFREKADALTEELKTERRRSAALRGQITRAR
jgi:uncharacterized protein YlxW (UPF0749 family)